METGQKSRAKRKGPKEKGPEMIRALLQDGGAEEDRTPDLRIANATLSQLSYRPEALNDSTARAGVSACAETPCCASASGSGRPIATLAASAAMAAQVWMP